MEDRTRGKEEVNSNRAETRWKRNVSERREGDKNRSRYRKARVKLLSSNLMSM